MRTDTALHILVAMLTAAAALAAFPRYRVLTVLGVLVILSLKELVDVRVDLGDVGANAVGVGIGSIVSTVAMMRIN